MRIHLITAESPGSRRLRLGRLIQFPQLTMPLLAALTPPEHEVFHTDEIVDPVRFDLPADLVGITAPTPSALHAYATARELRRRGVPVVIGGPHATALPEEAALHADAVVVGEAEDTWPRVLDDARRGRLERFYVSSRKASLAGMPPPRWDLIKGRGYGKSVTIATRGCPHRCDYCSIPLLYGAGTVRYRPIDEVVREVAASPTRAVVFWDRIDSKLRLPKERLPVVIELKRLSPAHDGEGIEQERVHARPECLHVRQWPVGPLAAAPGSGGADPEALTDPVGHGAIAGPRPAVDRREWPLPRYPRAVWEFDAGSDGG